MVPLPSWRLFLRRRRRVVVVELVLVPHPKNHEGTEVLDGTVPTDGIGPKRRWRDESGTALRACHVEYNPFYLHLLPMDIDRYRLTESPMIENTNAKDLLTQTFHNNAYVCMCVCIVCIVLSYLI